MDEGVERMVWVAFLVGVPLFRRGTIENGRGKKGEFIGGAKGRCHRVHHRV